MFTNGGDAALFEPLRFPEEVRSYVLTTGMNDRVRHVLDLSCSRDRDLRNTRVAKCGTTSLQLSDVAELVEKGLVQDNTIEFFLAMFCDANGRNNGGGTGRFRITSTGIDRLTSVAYLSSAVVQSLNMTTAERRGTTISWPEVETLTRMLPGDPPNNQLILVPINTSHTHWVLAVMQPSARMVHFFHSLTHSGG